MGGTPAGGAVGDDAVGPSLSLDIRNDIESVCRALEAVAGFLARHDVDDEASFTVRLAVEEIVTNVVKYAYGDAGPHVVGIGVRLSPDLVTVRVTDDGRPFDPLAAQAPDLNVPLEEKTVGGVGIHLLRNMLETLAYSRVGETNQLTATVRRTPKGGAPC